MAGGSFGPNGLNLPKFASDPSSPVEGQMYYNTTDQTVKFYNGSDWISLTGSGSSGASTILTLSPTGGGSDITWDGTANLVLDVSKEYTVSSSANQAVTVKMWGGGGALGFNYNDDITSTSNQGPGGGGGYTTGVIAFTNGGSYIFQVGEGGSRATATSSGATWRAGGLQQINPGKGGTEGAGYSGIFNTSVSQANALLIAGGGGGGSDSSYGSNGGGAGGGTSAGSAASAQGGGGASQSSGGVASDYNNATAGSALTGGLAGNASDGSTHSWLGGGGGGYYGGGGGNVGGGGGGSGYYKTSSPVSSGLTTAGTNATPGNSGDSLRSGAGQGAYAGYGSTKGADGAIILVAI
jgi:hypothetical protein